MREVFEKSLRGSGLKQICKELNDRGVTNRGKRWYKGTLHYVLRNEAYTGTAVWGRTSKGEKAQDPVRVEGAWPALISRELFDDVQQAMRERAPKVRRPARVGSRFLLSGLLKCGVCGRPYSAQGAKSGQFAYYICGTLFREGAGTCSARYLNAPKLEAFVVEKIRERILTEETIVELVTLVAEEIDAMAGELSGRLKVIEAELGDVRKRLERLYEAIETSELTLEVLSPRIMSLRHREEQLEAAREDAETQLEQRRVELPNTEEIARYVADFRDFLQEGTISERKALICNFVEGIEVVGDEATLTYTVPMPNDGVTSESASVLDFVKSGPPCAFSNQHGLTVVQSPGYNMGTFTIPLQIRGPTGQSMEVDALVDTEATHTVLPRDMLLTLGVEAVERVAFQLADERLVEYDVCEARIVWTVVNGPH